MHRPRNEGMDFGKLSHLLLQGDLGIDSSAFCLSRLDGECPNPFSETSLPDIRPVDAAGRCAPATGDPTDRPRRQQQGGGIQSPPHEIPGFLPPSVLMLGGRATGMHVVHSGEHLRIDDTGDHGCPHQEVPVLAHDELWIESQDAVPDEPAGHREAVNRCRVLPQLAHEVPRLGVSRRQSRAGDEPPVLTGKCLSLPRRRPHSCHCTPRRAFCRPAEGPDPLRGDVVVIVEERHVVARGVVETHVQWGTSGPTFTTHHASPVAKATREGLDETHDGTMPDDAVGVHHQQDFEFPVLLSEQTQERLLERRMSKTLRTHHHTQKGPWSSRGRSRRTVQTLSTQTSRPGGKDSHRRITCRP